MLQFFSEILGEVIDVAYIFAWEEKNFTNTLCTAEYNKVRDELVNHNLCPWNVE